MELRLINRSKCGDNTNNTGDKGRQGNKNEFREGVRNPPKWWPKDWAFRVKLNMQWKSVCFGYSDKSKGCSMGCFMPMECSMGCPTRCPIG